MSAAGVLDQLSPATLCSSLGVDGADVWAEAGGGLSVPARGLGTSERYRAEGVQPETRAYLCRVHFLTELISSAPSMPGAALAAPSGGSKRSGRLCPLAESWYSAGERQKVR